MYDVVMIRTYIHEISHDKVELYMKISFFVYYNSTKLCTIFFFNSQVTILKYNCTQSILLFKINNIASFYVCGHYSEN